MQTLERLNTALTFPLPEQLPGAGEAESALYGEFYEKYGALAVAAMPELTGSQPLLNGRVLHVDAPLDRSMHLFLYAPEIFSLRYSLPRTDTSGNPYRYYAYENEGIVAFVTDGQSVQTWRATDVNGTHWGQVNAIDKPYRPENETLHIRFGDFLKPHARIDVARTGEAGTVHFSSGLMAWILDEPTSLAERGRVSVATIRG